MEALDFKDIREQISEIAICQESYEDVSNVEEFYYTFTIEKYKFAGSIIVNGIPVYTYGSYTNDFENLTIEEFTADDEDLEEYLENYELTELAYKIEKAS
jgi:hypothetical protein